MLIVGTSVSAQSSGGMGGRPANPDPNNPRTQSIFIFTADRGETASDTILLSNNSEKTKTLDLYAVDGIVTNTGSFTCAQQSEAKQGVGGWIKIDTERVTLEAGKKTEVKFELAMPSSADVGEHNGCIVFQESAPDVKTTGNVQVLTRQAIRVVATIPGDLSREVNIAEFITGTLKGNPSLTLTLKNTGNVSADVDVKARLVTLFGGTVYENGGGYPVLANKQLELTYVNEDRPFFGGWYYASADISYDTRAGVLGSGNSENVTTKQTDRKLVFINPTPFGLFVLTLLVVAAAGFATWWSIRRRRQVDSQKSWKLHTVKEGENIQTIAEKAYIDWKELASVNKLKAPYILAVGQKINVPKDSKKQQRNSKKPTAS